MSRNRSYIRRTSALSSALGGITSRKTRGARSTGGTAVYPYLREARVHMGPAIMKYNRGTTKCQLLPQYELHPQYDPHPQRQSRMLDRRRLRK